MWRGPHWGCVSRGSRQLHVLQHEGEREGGKTRSRRSRRGCPRAGAEDAGATVGCGPVAQGVRGQAGSKGAPGVPGCRDPARAPARKTRSAPTPSLAQSPFELNFEKSHLFLLGPVWFVCSSRQCRLLRSLTVCVLSAEEYLPTEGTRTVFLPQSRCFARVTCV